VPEAEISSAPTVCQNAIGIPGTWNVCIKGVGQGCIRRSLGRSYVAWGQDGQTASTYRPWEIKAGDQPLVDSHAILQLALHIILWFGGLGKANNKMLRRNTW
jgi:hypothetical protein